MNWPNALKRLRTCSCGRHHGHNIWVGEPSLGFAKPGTMYNYGMCPPNYPVPTVKLEYAVGDTFLLQTLPYDPFEENGLWELITFD